MDTAQWPEGIGVVKVIPMEGNNNNSSGAAALNNKAISSAAAAPRPQKPQALNCPRCNSAHTKFCYYNNYSLTQPRYFCKTCRRYWTEGGSLRNVPVGGGSRKNKRSSSSSSNIPTITSSSSSLSKNIKLPHEIITSNSQNPNTKIMFHDQGQDLNLAYPPTGPSTYNSTAGISEFVEFPSASSSHHQFSQLLKSGIGGRGSFTSFMSMIPVSDSSNNNNNNSAAIFSSSSAAGLSFQELVKPITSGVNFSLDHQHGFESSGGGGLYGSLQLGVHQGSSGINNHAKLFNFPFEDLKQQPVHNSSATSTQDHELMDQPNRGTTTSTTQGDHYHHQSPSGYWNNINGGGSW